MATLETLRTKAGVFISILIGLALLAFIVNADTLATARAIFSPRDEVGLIAGDKIGYEEFNALLTYNTNMYQLTYNLMTNQEAKMTEEVNENLRNSTWDELIRKHAFEKEYRKIGLSVSEAELYDLTLGSNVSPLIASYFGNMDKAMIANFVQNASGDTKIFWVNLEKQILNQQLISRYTQLEQKSRYVNSLDVESALEGEKQNIEFSYILKDYASVADSLISFKESDLKNYYDKHKEEYQENRSRDVEFVAFTVKPSANDYEKVMNKMEQLQKQMDTISASSFPLFVRSNSDVPFDKIYRKKGELPANLDTVVFKKSAGDVLPYYQEGDMYSLSGIVEFKTLPDSVKAQHILFDQKDFGKIDSIYNLLKEGANFDEFAKQYSTDGSAAGGGDLGWFTFDKMVRPFSDSCFYNPVGSVMKVITQFGIHIVKITGAKEFNEKVLLATVKKNVLPTRETYQNYHAQATKIAAQSNGDIKKFRAICAEEGVLPYNEYNIGLENKNVGQFQNVSALIRWMYEAEEGDVSGLIEIDNKKTYIVAALTNVKNTGIQPYKKVRHSILPKVIEEKKAEYLIKLINDAKGANLDETASKLGLTAISVTPAVNFNTSFIPTLRLPEYKLLGAVTSTPVNQLPEPLAGESGVYMFTVTNKSENAQAQTVEAIRTRLESGYYSAFTVLYENAKIVDNRNNFY
ncbi:MAG: peptidylprolyl isomerase [Prevotellaceae bacterium]|jgi:peptidyl-prolyl cis-trans isomerase D|nr:peptidylprolyl isomerase [Prevotellaceae bacterium]